MRTLAECSADEIATALVSSLDNWLYWVAELNVSLDMSDELKIAPRFIVFRSIGAA